MGPMKPSPLARQSIALLRQRQPADALALAECAIRVSPRNWHAWYALGSSRMELDDIAGAEKAMLQAQSLARHNRAVMLALTVILQRRGAHAAAVHVATGLLRLDPDHVLAYDLLATSQRLMGDAAASADTCEAGLCAVLRRWACALERPDVLPLAPVRLSRHNLWIAYATQAADALCNRDGMADWEAITPSGIPATAPAPQPQLWRDAQRADGTPVRVLLANYFNNAVAHVAQEPLYARLLHSRAAALRLLGDEELAQQHLEEAQDLGVAERRARAA